LEYATISPRLQELNKNTPTFKGILRCQIQLPSPVEAGENEVEFPAEERGSGQAQVHCEVGQEVNLNVILPDRCVGSF